MNIINIIYFIVSLSAGVFSKHVRIVGGRDADITNFPYAVSFRLVHSNEHICGGAIISEWHVLTAAHCIEDFANKVAVILAGTTNILTTNGYLYTINQISLHPDYTGEMQFESMNRNDIGIVKVNEFISFNQFQNKVELPTEDAEPNDKAIIIGWGATSYPDPIMPDTLQKAKMEVISNSMCSQNLPFQLSDNQMCVFKGRGIGACIADSGSPLVKNGKIIGISSFLHPCALGAPDIYIRVYPYLNYIRSVISV